MTFSSALSNALSGMNAATFALQVRGHNVANATTPGYARHDVSLAARAPSGGVSVARIVRAEDAGLRQAALSAGADGAAEGTRADAAASLSGLLGVPGDEAGLPATLAAFERALADLSAAPESQSFQQRFLSASDRLSATFNRLGDEAQAMRVRADGEVDAGVRAVNDALNALHTLNRRTERSGGLSVLPEERQRHVDAIAEQLSVRVTEDDAGRVRIVTAGGVPLLGEAPRLLQFSPSGAIAAGQSRANGDLSGLSAGGIDLSPGALQGITAGRIAGAFAVRDEIAPAFADRLDGLATDLAERLAGVDADAGGQGLFVVTPGPGAASSLSVNPSVDPSMGGALWRLRDGLAAAAPGPAAASGVLPDLLSALRESRPVPATTGGPAAYTAAGALDAFASALGTERLTAEARGAAAGARAQGARDAHLAATGVSTDAEMQALLTLEQAYAANARVVQTVSAMMQTLLEI